MKIGLAFAWLMLCAPLQAQQRIIVPLEQIRGTIPPYGGSYIPEFNGYCKLDAPIPVDTTLFCVTYDLKMTIDTLVRHDRVVAEVGRRYSKFYSLYLWELSMNHTFPDRNVTYEWTKGCSVLFPSAIYVDKTKRQITNRVLLPYRDHFLYEYNEPLPDFSWRYEAGEKEVIGYRCMQATCNFRGRDWTIWYTPDIPCPSGFWKFHGLPGMVLAAYDSTCEYAFTAIGIEQSATPMLRYRIPSKPENREKIRSAERKIYAHPLDAFFAQTGQNYFVVSLNGKMKLITNEDNVSIPHNPLELE